MRSLSRFVSGVFWFVLIIGIVNWLILLFGGTAMYQFMKDDLEEGENIFLREENRDSGQGEKDTLAITQINFKK